MQFVTGANITICHRANTLTYTTSHSQLEPTEIKLTKRVTAINLALGIHQSYVNHHDINLTYLITFNPHTTLRKRYYPHPYFIKKTNRAQIG